MTLAISTIASRGGQKNGEASEKAINELSKAEFVRDLMEKGIKLADALRELAERMRRMQGLVKGPKK